MPDVVGPLQYSVNGAIWARRGLDTGSKNTSCYQCLHASYPRHPASIQQQYSLQTLSHIASQPRRTGAESFATSRLLRLIGLGSQLPHRVDMNRDEVRTSRTQSCMASSAYAARKCPTRRGVATGTMPWMKVKCCTRARLKIDGTGGKITKIISMIFFGPIRDNRLLVDRASAKSSASPARLLCNRRTTSSFS